MFAVVQRRRELALRQAVGATSGNLIVMIGREMSALVASGIAIGMAAAVLSFRLLSKFLFAVSPLDARVVVVTLAVVAAAGLVAALVPTRRAAAVDLMLVLRTE
jgi:ABC-type antimicrobial peptide transport system permease subunit